MNAPTMVMMMRDDSDGPGHLTDDETDAGRNLANDARLDEAIGLIDACRGDEALKAPHRQALRESLLLEKLGVAPHHSDASRAIEDAAAVLAAWAVAIGQADRKATTNAGVRKALEAALTQATRIDDAEQALRQAFTGKAGARARMLLEEAALRIIAGRAHGVDWRLSPFQRVAQQMHQGKTLWRPLSRAVFARHGSDVVRQGTGRLGRKAPPLTGVAAAARRHGLRSDLESTLAAMAETVPDLLWGEGTGPLLLEAAQSALASLRRSSEMSAYVVPPANIVLVAGALEVCCAWRPTERPTSTAGGPLAVLVEQMRRTLRPGDSEPRETICELVNAWRVGRAALLFDGRDPTRAMRLTCLRNMEFDAHYGTDAADEAHSPFGAGRFGRRRGPTP